MVRDWFLRSELDELLELRDGLLALAFAVSIACLPVSAQTGPRGGRSTPPARPQLSSPDLTSTQAPISLAR